MSSSMKSYTSVYSIETGMAWARTVCVEKTAQHTKPIAKTIFRIRFPMVSVCLITY